MNRKLASLLVLVLCLVLSACGSSGGNNSEETVTSVTEIYEEYTVTLRVDCVKNLMFSKYDIDIFVDGVERDTLAHGESSVYEYRVVEGEHTFTFASAEKSSVSEDITLDISCDTEASYEISCYSDYLEVTELYIDQGDQLTANQVRLQFDSSEFIYMDYKEVEQTLKDYGFANIEAVPVYDIIFGITTPGETDNVTINGSDSYKRGDILDRDVEIIITYHMPAEDDPNSPSGVPDTGDPDDNRPVSDTPDSSDESVYYSTNTLEKAKEGNSGVFAYKMSGPSYDTYYIVDFDEGHVYRFLEGDGNESCDRLSIDEGDLNSGVVVTYHDGEDTWQNYLHFKWKHQPDTLIMVDNDRFDTEFKATSLGSALALRDNKTIRDY